ncbi:MAG: hypothetical protein Q9228_003439 [Teloschistes exilis]
MDSLRRYFVCLSRALNYLHESDIRHKDIKPANVLLDSSNNVVLTDFGISRRFPKKSSHLTSDRWEWTHKYASPEIMKGKKVPRDDSSDIFSLGCVFLEMATLILGRDLDWMFNYYTTRVNDSGIEDAYHCNLEKIYGWIVCLQQPQDAGFRSASDPSDEQIDGQNILPDRDAGMMEGLAAIRQMLDIKPSERPTTQGLWSFFQNVSPRKCRDCDPRLPDEIWRPTTRQRDDVESSTPLPDLSPPESARTARSRLGAGQTQPPLSSPAPTIMSHFLTKMLGRLTELNDYLQKLMQNNQARELEQMTEITYMEVGRVRSSVEELKHLATTAAFLEKEGHSSASEVRCHPDQVFARLADFEFIAVAKEAPTSQKPSDYERTISGTHLNYSQIDYQESSDQDPATTGANASSSSLPSSSPASSRTRVEGKFFPGDGTFIQIWIEWKSYKELWSSQREKYIPQPDNLKRVRELAALLQSPKPVEFCAPHCLGYFDDRDDAENSQHHYRFGIVYEKPEKLAPVSLHEMMAKYPQPAAKNRLILAHKISVCILYLHAVNWLHKSLRSDSIVFFPPFKGLAEPYLTGYEYARADRPGETTTGGEVDEWTELYVHPDYQRSGTKGTYRKTFDIYSLGIILLEIAYWMPVEKIVGVDMEAADVFDRVKRVRAHLVRRDSKVMRTLSENLGQSYHDAVRACLQGREAFGIGLGESEVDVGVGAKLQREFTEKVTDGLERLMKK